MHPSGLPLSGALVVLLSFQAGLFEANQDSPNLARRSLLLFPSSECGSQAEILTIGVELLRRGHQITALVADGCAEEARHLLHSDKFLDPLPIGLSANGAGLVNSTVTPTPSSSSSSSSSSSAGSSMGAEEGSMGEYDSAIEGAKEGAKGSAGSCGSAGPQRGEEAGPLEGGCSLGEAGVEADKGEEGLGEQENENPAQQEQQQQQQHLREQEQEKREEEQQQQQQQQQQQWQQQQRQQQQQQQREIQRDALLQSMKLVVYPGHVSLEDFVATKAMLHDESTSMSLAHRTDFTLTNCGSLMANTGVMADLKGAGFDALVGDLSDACAWLLADALGVDARIDVDVTGSPAPPYLAYNMRYPLAYVPAEGSGLAGGSLTMMEKVKNLACHLKLWWEKWTVRVPKVEAFRRQYAELHPGLLRGQQTQQAQQAQQVQQAQQAQTPNMNSMEGSTGLPPTLSQQRQQKQRIALENELNSIKDVRLSTLLCIVTADWAFQEPYALPPLVKHVGPVGPGPAKPLPPALKTFLEAKGRRSLTSKASGDQTDPPAPPVVVVGSFSSGHYRLPRQAIVGLAEAFSELTLLRIVWHLPEAVQQKLGSWYRPVTLARHVHLTSNQLPLNDLLGHPNVRAFMCDGSLSSMYHALWHGVPMLTVALNAEQESNVVRALRLGVGRRLQRSHLEQGFGFMVEHTLGRLCSSTAYRIRAAELSRRMQAANPTPAKSAAQAIEGALEAGTSTFLHSMEVFLPWWKVMMLDVLAAFFGIILGTVATIWAASKLTTKAAAWAQGSGSGDVSQDQAEEMKKFR